MSKVLVAYFSASGVTAKAAQKLAKAAKGDLFEIKPEKPYTSADLNWNDKNSRSSVEMNDRSCRPAIASKLDNMADYDVVFVGFPVWWYREPSIIDTFIESYDLGGKTVVPFATSGGSGLGETAKNLQALAPAAKVVDGKKLSAMATEAEIENWVKTFC
ncbi:MAG: NAD(P)H-dependent oxidoreductase [Firmicutes bacterium]|nr:NAD(P)H-dependent oxidoreductase [Bacillota bacterium]